MLTRRELLKRSALLSLSPIVPGFLAQAARAATAEPDRRILVVIQLDGGNDGLNTVVPFRDENYVRLRPKLNLTTKELIKLNDDVGLHPAMKLAGELFKNGQLTVVQGVGYPNPNRSHFRSMAIWQSARLDESEHEQYGWLGRALDGGATSANSPQAVFVGANSLPVALWGRKTTSAAVRSLDDLAVTAPADLMRMTATGPTEQSDLAQLVASASQNAFATAERLTSVLHQESAGGPAYPTSPLGTQLKTVSALIKSGSAARVFYTVQSGYDTHASQADEHYQLLGTLSRALKAFLDDLAAAKLDDRVLVLAFSEFGRRAAENDSAGTDHGAAAPLFLAGANLATGIVGPAPDLASLQDGDVPMAIDFRQVFATVLDRWLSVPPENVLAGKFEKLPLFRA